MRMGLPTSERNSSRFLKAQGIRNVEDCLLFRHGELGVGAVGCVHLMKGGDSVADREPGHVLAESMDETSGVITLVEFAILETGEAIGEPLSLRRSF